MNETDVEQTEAAPELPGISFATTVPSIIPQDYAIVVHEEPEDERAGKAYFDKDSNTLNVYLQAGVVLDGEGVVKDVVNKFLGQEQYILPIEKIAHLTVYPELFRTCKFFTAASEQFKSLPLETSEDHPYDRPFSSASCSNPLMEPGSGCGYEQNQHSCRIYSIEQWKPVRSIKIEDSTITCSLESVRKSAGFVHYRITKIVDGTKVVEADYVPGDNIEVDRVEALEAFSSYLDTLTGIKTDLPIETETDVKIKYYDYVLAEA